jgi:hypothetical protein
MLTSRGFTIFTLLLVAVGVAYYSSLPAIASRQTLTSATNNSMSTHTVNLIKSVTLLAKEEKHPPLGVPQQPNRDIGFASVFLRLENQKTENVELIIQKIEIRNVSNGRIQMVSQQPEKIHLHPLENSENAFQLTNKTGYGGQKKVQAVITYQLGSQIYVIESEPVEVDIQ